MRSSLCGLTGATICETEDSRASHVGSVPLKSNSIYNSYNTGLIQTIKTSGAHPLEPIVDRTLHYHRAKKMKPRFQQWRKHSLDTGTRDRLLYCLPANLAADLSRHIHISQSCRIECSRFSDSRSQQNLVFQGQTSIQLPFRLGTQSKMFTHGASISEHFRSLVPLGL